MPHLTISTQSELLDYCARVSSTEWIAMDTEFVSEDSYRPQLCLVQVASGDGLALIDAVSVGDVSPFWRVLAEGRHETIFHAGRGDLEFCLRAVNKCPEVFSTRRSPPGWSASSIRSGCGI